MTAKQTVRAAIAHHSEAGVPFSLGCEGDVGERLDAHFGSTEWREACNRFITGVATVNTDRKEPVDGSSQLMRDPYGSLWRMDRRPWHLERPALAEPSLAGYDFPTSEAFLVPGGKDQARAVCAANAEGKFVVASIGWGLFERLWTIRGFENALIDLAEDSPFVHELLDRLTDLYLSFIEDVADVPADAILFGDDWGDQRGVIMGAARWRKLFKPRWQRLFAATHASGKLAMCHSCGSVAAIVPDLIEIGLDVLESVQPEAADMEPTRLKRQYGADLSFWGGLGSQSVIPFGTPAEIHAEVARLRRDMGAGGGYILAPAKPLQPETPTANAAAVVEAFLAA
jgi:uroporphyrinogen decarboxylase